MIIHAPANEVRRLMKRAKLDQYVNIRTWVRGSGITEMMIAVMPSRIAGDWDRLKAVFGSKGAECYLGDIKERLVQ